MQKGNNSFYMTQRAWKSSALFIECMLIFAPAMILYALLLRPFIVHDIGWQLKLGEAILNNHSPFVREFLSARHLGEQAMPNAWLAQLIFSQVNAWSGRYGLRAFDALLWIGGFLAAAIPARQRSERPLAILFALIIGCVVAFPTASLRPQSFAALAFGLMLAILQSANSKWRALLLGAPLFILWQNLHPSVPLAVLVIGSLAGLHWALHIIACEERPWGLTALAIVACAAVFATPAGWGIIEFSKYNKETSVIMGISEWFPMWSVENRQFISFMALPFFAFISLVLADKIVIKADELIAVIITLVMAALVGRFLLFYGIAIVPVLARAKLGPLPIMKRPYIILVALVTCAAIAAESLLLPLYIEPEMPIEGVQRLKDMHVKGTIFCDWAFGGLIIDAGYPSWKVAFDGRFYLYSPSEWLLFRRTMVGPVQLSELDRLYHPVAYVLAPYRSAALIGVLRASPETWREIYADPKSAVFVKSRNYVANRSAMMPQMRRTIAAGQRLTS